MSTGREEACFYHLPLHPQFKRGNLWGAQEERKGGTVEVVRCTKVAPLLTFVRRALCPALPALQELDEQKRSKRERAEMDEEERHARALQEQIARAQAAAALAAAQQEAGEQRAGPGSGGGSIFHLLLFLSFEHHPTGTLSSILWLGPSRTYYGSSKRKEPVEICARVGSWLTV